MRDAARFLDALKARFGDRARAGVRLAPLTTFKVGGPAEWLVEAGSGEELRDAVRIAREWSVPVTLLGGGSNVLVADCGITGLVVHPARGHIGLVPPPMEGDGVTRAQAATEGDGASRAQELRADAGVTINGLVRFTISRGLAGLEAWAGTPGTVGGGIHGNAHFQGRLLSEHVTRAGLLTPAGDDVVVEAADMGFGYDRSRLQHSGEVLLWAGFRVARGDPEVLRATARASLAYRKRTQPLHLPSAGCIFQNPAADEPLPPGMPRSAGALIDRAGLKGARLGGARVSDVHANFVVNDGGASAADIRALVERCRSTVQARFGLALRDEIVYLGDFGADGPWRPPLPGR